jgi:hypothetical protein
MLEQQQDVPQLIGLPSRPQLLLQRRRGAVLDRIEVADEELGRVIGHQASV